MKIEHNSHNKFCRTPFGAAACVSDVTLRLLLGTSHWPQSAELKYEINGEKFSKQMYYHSTMLDAYVYETVLTMPDTPCLVLYHFEVNFGDFVIYYGNNPDRMGGIGSQYMSNPIPYQITVYNPSYKTPDWLKSGIMYQIFPDRFCKSESFDMRSERSDIIPRSWGDVPYHTPEQFGGKYLANDFFGGSLYGIIEKLPYLADLGITVIYLNPVFKAYSNHRYDTGDYEKIDPLLGDENIFKELCERAKSFGMKIILDGVFNHTGSDSKYFNKNGFYDTIGAYQSQNSPYYDWYIFERYPDKYDCWWGIETLPAINELSDSYKRYILTDENSIVKKWVQLGASGWRLDVVDELPGEFVETLRREVKSVNPDAAVIGEVWEDASNKTSYGVLRDYLGGNQLDSAMNYPLKNALTDFVLCRINAGEFNRRIYSLFENYPREAFMAMMNFLSSHDTERIFTKMADVPDSLSRPEQALYTLTQQQRETAEKRVRIIYTLIMCLPGMPSIFYGDEIGAEGFGDPFCRSCFDWSKVGSDLHSFFKSIISMRKNSEALTCGDFDIVYGDGQVSAFVRESAGDFKLVIVNTAADTDWYAPLELGRFGVHALIHEQEYYESEHGRFVLHMQPMSIKIYDVKRHAKEEAV